MIKKIISVAFVASVLSVAVYNYTQSKNGTSMDNLSLANVEALADGESGDGKSTCYNTITTKEGSMVLYCQTCTWVSGTDSWVSGTGRC